jgi:hypothetical protein
MDASTRPRDIVILALTVAGAALGWRLISAQSSWRPLGTPPEAAQIIKLATPSLIVIQTASGHIYGYRDAYSSYAYGGSPQGRWTTRPGPVEGWDAAQCSKNTYVPADRDPPGAMRDSISCLALVEQSQIGMIYAILDDGSVWRWSNPLWPEKVGGVFLVGLGGLCGLLLGAALVRLLPLGLRLPARL